MSETKYYIVKTISFPKFEPFGTEAISPRKAAENMLKELRRIGVNPLSNQQRFYVEHKELGKNWASVTVDLGLMEESEPESIDPITEAAMTLFKAPFTYNGIGWITDANMTRIIHMSDLNMPSVKDIERMKQDNGIEMPLPKDLVNKMGQLIATALNDYWAKLDAQYPKPQSKKDND